MQVLRIVRRRGTTFHKRQLRAFVHDNERSFELPGTFGVDAKVRLQRLLYFYVFRNIDKTAATKHRAVQRRKTVVDRRDDFRKIRLKNIAVGTKTFASIGKDNAFVFKILLHFGIRRLAVELRFDARQKRPLFLGYTQTLKGRLNVLGNVFPTPLRLLPLRHVVTHAVKINVVQFRRHPIGQGRVLENF